MWSYKSCKPTSCIDNSHGTRQSAPLGSAAVLANVNATFIVVDDVTCDVSAPASDAFTKQYTTATVQ